jgi:hypothetical protein
MFLRSHYLAAEIASLTVEWCSALLFLIRLMCLNGARHGFRLGQWCRLGFILPLSVHALSLLEIAWGGIVGSIEQDGCQEKGQRQVRF